MNADGPQCVILAGGAATRLGSIAQKTPKPLLPVHGKPFLWYIILQLAREGVRRFTILAGPDPSPFTEFVSTPEFRKLGLHTRIIQEAKRLGTAGALMAVETELDERFYLCNGDSMIIGDISLFFNQSTFFALETFVAAVQVSDAGRYGTLKIDHQHRVSAFAEKRASAGPAWINGGLYCTSRGTFSETKKTSQLVSLETDVLPKLARKQKLRAINLPGDLIDIGTPESYRLSQIDAKISEFQRSLDQSGGCHGAR